MFQFKIWIAIVSLESNHEPRKFFAGDTRVIVAAVLSDVKTDFTC